MLKYLYQYFFSTQLTLRFLLSRKIFLKPIMEWVFKTKTMFETSNILALFTSPIVTEARRKNGINNFSIGY